MIYTDKKIDYTESSLNEVLRNHPLDQKTREKIELFIFDDSPFPPGQYFKKETSSEQMMYKEAALTSGTGLNMHSVKNNFEGGSSDKLIQETIRHAQSEGHKKIGLLNIASFVLKEKELVFDLCRYAQLTMNGTKELAAIHDLKAHGVEMHFVRGRMGWKYSQLGEVSAERLLFNLWLKDEVNGDSSIALENNRVIKRIRVKLLAMEEFSRSKDLELAALAKGFLHLYANNELVTQANQTLLKCKSDLEEGIKCKIWPVVTQITPLFGILMNALFRYDEQFQIGNVFDEKWALTQRLPYGLTQRVSWITSQRLMRIFESALACRYFEKQHFVMSVLKAQYEKLNAGAQTTVDRFDLSPAPKKAPEPPPPIETKVKKEKVEKQKKPVIEPKPVPLAWASSSSCSEEIEHVEEIPAEVFSLSNVQERFKVLWEKCPFTYASRVARWVKAATVDAVRSFKDNGQLPYENIESEKELLALLKLHAFLPVEKIYADKEWRRRFTFKTDTGFGMICRLKTPEGKLFKGTAYIGFHRDKPQEIIHHFFVLANRDNETFKSFMSSVSELKREEDHFYEELGEHQLLWNDVLCEITGNGINQMITMKGNDGMEISVIPHNTII